MICVQEVNEKKDVRADEKSAASGKILRKGKKKAVQRRLHCPVLRRFCFYRCFYRKKGVCQYFKKRVVYKK